MRSGEGENKKKKRSVSSRSRLVLLVMLFQLFNVGRGQIFAEMPPLERDHAPKLSILAVSDPAQRAPRAGAHKDILALGAGAGVQGLGLGEGHGLVEHVGDLVLELLGEFPVDGFRVDGGGACVTVLDAVRASSIDELLPQLGHLGCLGAWALGVKQRDCFLDCSGLEVCKLGVFKGGHHARLESVLDVGVVC